MSERRPDPKFPAYNTARVAELVPYARNARTHSDAQVARIAASIREFGFTNPVLVDGERGVIAGHGRLLAARKLGMAEVPVIELSHLSEAQKRAYILADNRLALDAGWDEELLRIELGDLRDLGFDLDLTGFGADEIGKLLIDAGDGLTDPDLVPEAPENPVSRLGDAWVLGRHRLMCGDATDEATVAKALNGVRPHLCVTDPPYGVSYDPGWRNRAGVSGTKRTGRVENDHRADWRGAWALFPGEVAYVSGTGRCTPPPSPRASSPAGSRSAPRSSGPRSGWCSGAGTTTGSTSRAGTPSGAPAIGPGTAGRPRSGRSPARARTPRRCTAPRSRSSA
jgi:ParB-like nuclease domain